MSLFRSSLRPPAILSDEALERYVAAIRADLQPDPLFRRRLRGRVLNRFVAVREELVAPAGSRAMGRLGRAVLYASFTLMLGVSSTMAASQSAIPGDALYPLKRQIEDLRLQALPAQYHDELVAYALTERVTELDRLAELGRWDAVAAHAASIEAEFAALGDVDGSNGPVGRHIAVLGELLERLPDRARLAVEGVIDEVADLRGRSDGVRNDGEHSGTGGSSGGSDRAGGSGGGNGSGSGGATPPRATPSPPGRDPSTGDSKSKPDPTPKGEPRSTPASESSSP